VADIILTRAHTASLSERGMTAMENLQLTNQTVNPPILANTTTKAELFSRAKDAIESGETSLRDAADALALAKENFDATQREMAEAIGRSASWVNRLLKWQQSSYKEYSPFGPTITQAGRVSHAQQKAKATTRKPRNEADADDPEVSGKKRKALFAKLYPDAETTSSSDTKATTCTNAEAYDRELPGRLPFA
jgi:hypothetical protein